jgi:uncharacterized protein YraI
MSYLEAPSATPSLMQRLWASVLRIVFVLGAMPLMLGALVLGIVAASGVMLWALLRGRRPGPVNLRWGPMPRPPGFRRTPPGEVVDVQAREVDGPPRS